MATQRTGNAWSYSMYKKVLMEYPIRGDALAEEMNVSVKNLRERAHQLGVSYHKPFTEQEDDMYRKYRLKLKGAMVFLMPYRSPAEIGLHK